MYAFLSVIAICLTFIIIAIMYKNKNCDIEVMILGAKISIIIHDKKRIV